MISRPDRAVFAWDRVNEYGQRRRTMSMDGAVPYPLDDRVVSSSYVLHRVLDLVLGFWSL